MNNDEKIVCSNLICKIKNSLSIIQNLRSNYFMKIDNSYVSEGDIYLQKIIFDYLEVMMPNHTLISEESYEEESLKENQNDSYVILDPIDGTENFISGLREWGIGISIYTAGKHASSMMYLPELDEFIMTGMEIRKYKSRIKGLSSSLQNEDLLKLDKSFEYRIIGCSMYNMLSVIKGSFNSFENLKGVNSWDILPGINLALEHGRYVEVDGVKYNGELLLPTKKYKVFISSA